MTMEQDMTYIGQVFRMGDSITVAGIYEHTAIGCGNKHTFNHVGGTFGPCSSPDCKATTVPWKLVKETGTS
jgi:hypothetical protein